MIMNTRDNTFTPPYVHPESFFMRHIETIMQFTYKYPVFMKDLFYFGGISGLMVMTSPWILPALGITEPFSTSVAAGMGTAGMLCALTGFGHAFLQQRVFGLPVPNNKNIYEEGDFTYETATAKIKLSGMLANEKFPLLKIKAENAYDAGYVEGYILAKAIKHNLEKSNFLYTAMRFFLGAPNNEKELEKDLKPVLAAIPLNYQREMQGKVQGYNDWRAKHSPTAEKLSFSYYLLLQLLPDLHNNYNPFPKKGALSKLISLLKPFTYKPKMGCTTTSLHLGDYTFFARVLDWPAHGVAGESFIQIERKIGNVQRTIDIGLPLLSGAATVLNEEGMLIEINISPGDEVTKPAGMPAFFFNRYCAERTKKVEDIDALIKVHQPLSAYHLTATDGSRTQSFHFYHDQFNPEKHTTEYVETKEELQISSWQGYMEARPKNYAPASLIVANYGLQHRKDMCVKIINHDDSMQRTNNIRSFLEHHQKKGLFTPYLNKQKENNLLTEQELRELKELLLQTARLPLVNNCESVLCALFVYHKNELLNACAAVDNGFAQNKELNEFRKLRF